MDITNLDAIRQMVAQLDVKCIINCAAWTNVDAAETVGDIVEQLNAKAPENLAMANERGWRSIGSHQHRLCFRRRPL